MNSMDEIWFTDTPTWMDTTTISQFLDDIEGRENWRDDFKKAYAFCHLKGMAFPIVVFEVNKITEVFISKY